ncbi:MAG: hypothetical protein D6690_07065 [Nitrospirae bacterium]|nr:MAG: hypothetical protein D6690_07065 [Nitrospirota bacterium]
MQVQLDEERWEMEDSTSLHDALTRLSDLAHAKGRLITSLRVGNRTFTDRDLLPAVLYRPLGDVGMIVATSERMDAVILRGEEPATHYGAALRTEAETLVKRLRRGERRFRQIDDWLGRLADYIEWVELAKPLATSSLPPSPAEWIPELLKAREAEDTVRLADLLEYEVLSRLPSAQAEGTLVRDKCS